MIGHARLLRFITFSIGNGIISFFPYWFSSEMFHFFEDIFLFLNTDFGEITRGDFFLARFISLLCFMFPSPLVPLLPSIWLLSSCFRGLVCAFSSPRDILRTFSLSPGYLILCFLWFVFSLVRAFQSRQSSILFSQFFFLIPLVPGRFWFSQYPLRGCRDGGVISGQYRISVVFIVHTSLFPCL